MWSYRTIPMLSSPLSPKLIPPYPLVAERNVIPVIKPDPPFSITNSSPSLLTLAPLSEVLM